MPQSGGPYHVGATPTFRWVTAIQRTQLLKPAAEGALTITVGKTTNYADTNNIVINPSIDEEREERRVINGAPTEHVITLTVALAFAHAVGEYVGELANPTTVVLTLLAPDGTSSTPTVTTATGVHTATAQLTQAGQWKVQWKSTGTAADEYEYTVDVLTSSIP